MQAVSLQADARSIQYIEDTLTDLSSILSDAIKKNVQKLARTQEDLDREDGE